LQAQPENTSADRDVLVASVFAVASSRVMESFVFGIEPTDPITYAAVTAVMLLTAGLAAWVPARRAAAVDPARVLKGE
jgi:ABC-type antimicrobial peptide transport system permease subunit